MIWLSDWQFVQSRRIFSITHVNIISCNKERETITNRTLMLTFISISIILVVWRLSFYSQNSGDMWYWQFPVALYILDRISGGHVHIIPRCSNDILLCSCCNFCKVCHVVMWSCGHEVMWSRVTDPSSVLGNIKWELWWPTVFLRLKLSLWKTNNNKQCKQIK